MRLIDALQLSEVRDGSKWLRLPVAHLGTHHELPAMTIGIDPDRKAIYYCDGTFHPTALKPSYFGSEATFTLERLFGECALVDAKKSPGSEQPGSRAPQRHARRCSAHTGNAVPRLCKRGVNEHQFRHAASNREEAQ
jgi:hypothetical protein